MAPNDTLARLDGPYESWVFGSVGQSYASPDGQLASASFISALAELPVIHPFFKEETALVIPDMGIAHRPTIWQGPATSEAAGGTAFLPLIFEPLHIERPFALTDLRLFMLAVANFPIPPSVEVAPKPHHGFRFNAPLPRKTFNQSFAEARKRPEPTLQPNARLKAELARGGHQGAPLVIMAVIDDGLAYAHPALRDAENDPRMEFCWLQSAEVTSSEAESGTVLFGREHTRETLATLLKREGDDEDAFYRAAGSIRRNGMAQPVAGLSAHGAHVLHLAAGAWGDEASPAELDRIRLIGVELPSPIVMDTVGFGKDAHILSAVHYIFDRADRIAAAYDTGPLPLVINFSFGFTGGPHDGNDRLEDAIRALILARKTKAPTELVMPAGNQFLSALHAQISTKNLGAEDRFSIPWRIQPNDRTANYLEIWYPAEVEGELRQPPEPPRVSGPGDIHWKAGKAAAITTQTPPQTLWPLTINGRTYGQVSIDKFREARWRIMVILAPTETTGTTPSGAPAGLWRIDIDASAAREQDKIISCRIQHDRNIAHPLHQGRQSYFDHPKDPAFAADGRWEQDDERAEFTRRFGSLNGLATSGEVIVVAGVVAHSAVGPDLPAAYSSAGSNPPSGKTVTCAAISDHSPALPGVRAAGTRSGSVSRLSGTSAAAPQIARARALRLLRDKRGENGSEPPLQSGDQTPPQNISAKLDLRPRPGHSSHQRISSGDRLSARIGAGVLDARTPD